MNIFERYVFENVEIITHSWNEHRELNPRTCEFSHEQLWLLFSELWNVTRTYSVTLLSWDFGSRCLVWGVRTRWTSLACVVVSQTLTNWRTATRDMTCVIAVFNKKEARLFTRFSFFERSKSFQGFQEWSLRHRLFWMSPCYSRIFVYSMILYSNLSWVILKRLRVPTIVSKIKCPFGIIILRFFMVFSAKIKYLLGRINPWCCH